MNDRTPPHDPEAELACLAIVLNRGRIPDTMQTLTGRDFYDTSNEAVWNAAAHLAALGKPCSAIAVNARLMETQQHRFMPAVLEAMSGGYVTDPETAAGIVLDRSGRRHIIDQTTRTLNEAYTSDAPYEAILQRAEANLAAVPARDDGSVESLVTLEEFLGEKVPEPEWVIDGLLARGERLILTGLEGLGKSTLTRQLAFCAAAGMDPFTGRGASVRTVLVIDAENPTHIMQKRYAELQQAVHRHGNTIKPTNFWIDRRPQGLNVADPADRRWLQRRVKVVNPDLLVIGPAYKLHTAGNDDKDETIARLVTEVLDDLRVSVDCALVLEHHSGNEQGGMHIRPVRPYGSSLWRRWPEFGYGLRPIKPPKGMDETEVDRRRLVDLVPWRGGRDDRPWPRQMESGGDGMPWVETVIDYSSRSA